MTPCYYCEEKACDVCIHGDADADELREQKADAERYRWLRKQDDSSDVFCVYGDQGMFGECGHTEINGDLLDFTIDKEMLNVIGGG